MKSHESQTPPSLLEMQQWMKRILIDPRGAGPALESDAQLSGKIIWISTDVACLDIYAEAYLGRIKDALTLDFSGACAACGGESEFSRLIARYLDQHPSRFFNIGEVGEALPHFIAQHVDFFESSEQAAAVAEAAALDWALIEAFYADDQPEPDLLGLQGLSEEQWPTVRIALKKSVRLLQGELLVWRDAQKIVRHQRVAPAEFWALQQLESESSLQGLCERIEAQAGGEENLPPLMGWFSSWVSRGAIHFPDFSKASGTGSALSIE